MFLKENEIFFIMENLILIVLYIYFFTIVSMQNLKFKFFYADIADCSETNV